MTILLLQCICCFVVIIFHLYVVFHIYSCVLILTRVNWLVTVFLRVAVLVELTVQFIFTFSDKEEHNSHPSEHK